MHLIRKLWKFAISELQNLYLGIYGKHRSSQENCYKGIQGEDLYRHLKRFVCLGD